VERFGISHSTVQVESTRCADDAAESAAYGGG
jgi:hypothetical protein